MIISIISNKSETHLGAQRVKYLPVTRETWVPSLDWEDPLEKGMTTHSSILAWRIPWSEESGGLQSLGLQKVGHDGRLTSVTSVTHLGSGDRNSSTHTTWMTINRRPFFKKKERFFYIAISQFLDLFFWVTLSSTKIMHAFIQEYIHSLKFMSDRP